MTAHESKHPDATHPISHLLPQDEALDFATQVRAEYAKYLEKRDAIRKASGRMRRTVLHRSLMS